MAGANFKKNRNIDRERDEMTGDKIKEIALANHFQPMLDSLASKYKGRPVSEIKPILSQEWSSIAGGSISDPQLTEFATYISAGTRIDLTTHM